MADGHKSVGMSKTRSRPLSGLIVPTRQHDEIKKTEVGAAIKFLTTLQLLPLHWLVVAATAKSVSFFKPRNRHSLLRYFATTTTIPIPKQEQRKREGRRDSFLSN